MQTAQDKLELNRKLAEWAGFKRQKTIHELPKSARHEANLGWLYPNGQWRRYEPDFTQSLDTCFKWLVPTACSQLHSEFGWSISKCYDYIFNQWLQILMQAAFDHTNRPALALCLAIEKLSKDK